MRSITLPLLFAFMATIDASPLVSRNDTAKTFAATSGTQAAIRDSAPVGLSVEFFQFPKYFQNVTNFKGCLATLDAASNSKTRVRLGGTSQDSGLYDPNLAVAINFTQPMSLNGPTGVPTNQTIGPKYFEYAGQLSGPVIVGLNRRLNNLTNTVLATKDATRMMANLDSVELGNEPDTYGFITKGDPIYADYNITWSPAADAQSQVNWQKTIGQALGSESLVQAGVWGFNYSYYGVYELGPVEQRSGSLRYVKSFCTHAYPQTACGGLKTNLSALQDHSSIHSFLNTAYAKEVTSARSVGKPIYMGETNSASCGGGGISPTFGAALWIVDYTLQSIVLGYDRMYFHQGTVDASPYNWFYSQYIQSPFYGAYFAATALSGMTSIAQLDDNTSPIAVFALYKHGKLARIVIQNSNFYSNTSTVARPSQSITLTSLPSGCKSLQAVRLTAPYAEAEQGLGAKITVAGQTFSNSGCGLLGQKQEENYSVSGNTVTVTVWASEALLVYL